MKSVLITGANKGIGFETAKQLARLDYFVFLGSRDNNNGSEALNRLKKTGLSNVELLQIDVTDIDSVKRAKSTLESSVESLDILINNAGIPGEQPQNIATCRMDIMRNVFETNYFGVVQTTQQFLPLLQKSSEPVIVNVSSEVGSLTRQTSPDRRSNWDIYSVYGTSKTALNAFTIALANEQRNTNFRIVSVTPGYTATDLNNYQGFKTVEEGVKPIVQCAISKEYITGHFYNDEGVVPW